MSAPSRPAPRELLTPQALGARAELATLPRRSAGAIATVRTRYPDLSAAVVSALATQIELSARAASRLGELASTWVLDDEALQQATRLDVARYRASEVARRTTARCVADLGCGLGVDAYAFAEAGFTVRAVERNPWRAEAAQINLTGVSVTCGDALLLPDDWWQGVDVAYVDPARRRRGAPRDSLGGRSRALTDPEHWSPPWSWIGDLSHRTPVVAKVAPGIDVRRIPDGADVEWVDHDGETVEATIWLGALGSGQRRATVIVDHVAAHIEAPRTESLTGRGTTVVGTWLIEPAPAVRRARLVGELSDTLRAPRLEGSDWLTAEAATETALARAWSVIDELPWTAKDLRARLRGAGPVTWKTTDAGMSAADCDRRVGHRPARDGSPVTLVVTAQRRVFAVSSRQD